MANAEVKVKLVDMEEELKEDAVKKILEAVKEFTIEREIAESIKKYFDEKYEAAWHCIVGKSFGSFVTHETKSFILASVNDFTILLWKNGTSCEV